MKVRPIRLPVHRPRTYIYPQMRLIIGVVVAIIVTIIVVSVVKATK